MIVHFVEVNINMCIATIKMGGLNKFNYRVAILEYESWWELDYFKLEFQASYMGRLVLLIMIIILINQNIKNIGSVVTSLCHMYVSLLFT